MVAKAIAADAGAKKITDNILKRLTQHPNQTVEQIDKAIEERANNEETTDWLHDLRENSPSSSVSCRIPLLYLANFLSFILRTVPATPLSRPKPRRMANVRIGQPLQDVTIFPVRGLAKC